MRKVLLSALSLLMAATASAQSLNEGFEGDTDLPEGWAATSNGTAYTWSRVKHGSGSLQYRKGFTSGGTYTMQTKTGKTTTTKPAPDVWLITPQVTVQSGDYLSFMLAYAPVYNAAANTAETSRTKFQILVSEGDTAKANFTTTLYEFTPVAETDWRNLSISLEQFAGKTVHIAFREYGATEGGPITTNYIWLDDVKVQQGGTSDCVVTNLTSPVSGYEATQNVALKVFNAGLPAVNPTLSYKVGDGEPVTETYEGTIATGDTLTYTFASPVTLERGRDAAFKAWVTADNDGNHDNDSISTTITADNLFALPYQMTTDNNAVGWTYTYHKKSGKNYTGWWNTPDTSGEVMVWAYATATKESLLQGKWFSLPKGKVKMTFDYTTTLDAPVTVSLIDTDGATVGSFDVTLPTAADRTTQSATFTVDAAGDYTLSFKVGDFTGGKLQLYALNLEEQVPGDVAVTAIASPVYNAQPTTVPVAVKATIENKGGEQVENVPVHVSVDGVEAFSATIASIAGGASVDYAFADGLTLTAGSHDIAVYTTLEDDKELLNDTAKVSVFGYDPRVFPLKEDFETEELDKQWTSYNPDGDQLFWSYDYAVTAGVNYAKDGDHVAYMPSLQGTEHNDWLVSPAFTVSEPTKARLSYYYTTRYQASGTDGTVLDAYLVKGPELSLPVEGTPLNTVTVTDANVKVYRQAYALTDITEAGTYYIAIRNSGQGHDIVLDDLRFDAAEDLAVVGASHTAQTGFSLSEDKVTVQIANHGTTARSNFAINATVNGEQKLSTTYMAAVEPGDTLTYTFSQGLNISEPGEYTVAVNVSDALDSDSFNNAWTFDAYTNYAVATVPYEANFDDADQQAQWTLGGAWQTGTYSSSSAAYNGTGAISHHKKADADGDWAYSGAISIPAGTYDLDFFFRTYLNGRTANLYKQSFALYLGKEANAEAMTQQLYAATDTIAAEKRYKRVRQQFTVAEDGTYYVGVKCTSQASYGVLFIDQLTISESVLPTVALETYEDSKFDAWYHYDQSNQFNQWTAIEDGTGITTQSKVFNAGNAQEVPGALVLYPGYYVGAGETLSAEIDYSQSADETLSADQQALVITGLYLGTSDMPDAFTTAIVTGNDLSGEKQTATASVSVADAGVYWFALKVTEPANGDANTTVLTYNVYRVKIVAEQATGISRVLFSSDAPVEVYSAGGLYLGTFADAATATNRVGKGVFIVRQGETSMKMVNK